MCKHTNKTTKPELKPQNNWTGVYIFKSKKIAWKYFLKGSIFLRNKTSCAQGGLNEDKLLNFIWHAEALCDPPFKFCFCGY